MTADPSPARTPLPRRTRIFYGVGSVAYGVKDNGFAFFLLLYYNQVLGLPADLASLAIFLALVVDAVSDPIVGGFSDRLHAKWGRRHPFMYAAALPVAVVYYLLWNPPALGENELFLYLLASAICVRTLITFFEIPSTALGPELTEDYDERTLLMATRYFFGWTGGIALSVVTYLYLFEPTPEFPVGQLNPAGYQVYGLLAAGLMLASMLTSAIGTHSQIPKLRVPPPRQPFAALRVARELRETLANRSFLSLFCYGIFAAIAGGVVGSMHIYLNTYFWGFSAQQIALLVPSSFVSAGLAYVFTPRIAGRLGKRRAAIVIAVAAAVLAPVPIALRLVDAMPANGSAALLAALTLYNVVEVAFIIVSTTLVSAMMADVVEESELRTGRRSEGTFFAARSFIKKSATGLGLVVATTLLTSIGFPDGAVPGEVPAQTIRRLGVGYAPLVTLLYGASILCLFGYGISRDDHTRNLEQLAVRRKESEA